MSNNIEGSIKSITAIEGLRGMIAKIPETLRLSNESRFTTSPLFLHHLEQEISALEKRLDNFMSYASSIAISHPHLRHPDITVGPWEPIEDSYFELLDRIYALRREAEGNTTT